ncbi:hypothetical protein C8322_13750 [Acinetobacter sp. SM1B]|uniref:hypothetical protein n=1 Tax=Acinetobacter sp. SM1B TaxID=1497337 RepID=UPI000DCC0648|nr:hypothetical protein [Acinetobacter sp. SM1B]RAZ02988.1 hypothetical protein C8322_13750 [Acinetobacter sp. SM1B]
MRTQHTLNLFQQNIFVQQVNININIYPVVNTMLQDLNIAFNDFKTSCEFSGEIEVREKALNLLARYRTVIENKKDFYHAVPSSYSYANNYNNLSKHQLLTLSFLETGLILLSTFLENAAKFDSQKISIGLYKDIKDLYENSFMNRLDSRFWYDLQLFEFSIKEEVIPSWNRSQNNFVFSADQLEDFFSKHRRSVLKDIRGLDNIINPLDNYETSTIFQMYNKVESFKEKLELKKLITVSE